MKPLDTDTLPCKIRFERGGHYAAQATWFTANGRRFRPIYVGIEKYKNEHYGFGRSIYKCTAHGKDYFFFAPKNSGFCVPFKLADINSDTDLELAGVQKIK